MFCALSGVVLFRGAKTTDGWLRGLDSESDTMLASSGSNLVKDGMPKVEVG